MITSKALIAWAGVLLLSLTGVPLLLGGAWLVLLGGSLYYVFAGAALISVGVLLAQGRMEGVWLYAIYIVVTVIWSIWEVGFEFWSLVPRILLPVILALFVVAASVRHVLTPRYAVSLFVLVSIASAPLVMAFIPRDSTVVASSKKAAPNVRVQAEWRHYGRTWSGTRFSPANQIDPGNVHRLQVAWVYRMGDPKLPLGAAHQVTPLQVGNHLYLCTNRNDVIALDAETGRQLWRFDANTVQTTHQRCRGVGYHEVEKSERAEPHSCRRRVITSTIDVRLIALDADTGELCQDFGVRGVVDLKIGMGEVKHDYYFQTSAPLVTKDLVVVGGIVRDDFGSNDMPSGVIRAFNATSGALIWAWDPANPRITGLPRNGEVYSRGSPNMWSTPSYDEDLGLIYAPLGEPTGATEFWGGWRSKEIDYYANSVVALDVETGRPRWHFQTVHHDVWDYDLPPQPTLIDIRNESGSTIPALIQGTKRGQIFLLDRRNGKPLAPVAERPVPDRGQPDDRLSVTQPYSVGMPAIGAERLTEADMWGLTPIDQLWCRILFRRVRYEGDFTPPTTADEALIYPGLGGGLNWGGVAIDQRRGYLLVNDIRLPTTVRLIANAGNNRVTRRNLSLPDSHISSAWHDRPAPYGRSIGMLATPLGLPCNAPPWGTLTAIDIASRRIVWEIPIGTTRDAKLMGFELGFALPIGTPTLGGAVVTGSGLVFFGGARDGYLRAIDVDTGVELWRGRLPVGAQATPMTYISKVSGRQFVVIVAGGIPASEKTGDYVVAFALK